MSVAVRVLIVEDEAVIAFMLERQLKMLGCEVAQKVIFGEEALAAYQAHQPDLVLMDLHLAGDMSGLDAARSILAQAPAARIVFMTAYAIDKVKQEIAQVQHLAYLEKPIPPDRLRILVEQVAG